MNALIKENRDISIAEYCETLAEVESVEGHSSRYLQTASGIVISNQLPKEAINQNHE